MIPNDAYSAATDSDIICLVISLTCSVFVLPLAIVINACVTSSTLFSMFNVSISRPVIASFALSISKSKTLITVDEVGLTIMLIPPRASATA